MTVGIVRYTVDIDSAESAKTNTEQSWPRWACGHSGASRGGTHPLVSRLPQSGHCSYRVSV